MWDQLAEHAHLVAVDLPGFGHSEGREDLFSSRGMAGFIVKLADAFELAQPHAIGPDIGTSALLLPRPISPAGSGAWWSAEVARRSRSSLAWS
jgi:pimeloyl-ACP methyl ester carboxylesterase